MELVALLIETHRRWLPTAKAWDVEVRSHGTSRIDLCLWTSKEVVAVEAKRMDWKRAVAQASLNKYCADRSYVALWTSAVTPAVLAEANRLHLGVLSIGPAQTRVLLRAPKVQPSPALRSRIAATLKGGNQ